MRRGRLAPSRDTGVIALIDGRVPSVARFAALAGTILLAATCGSSPAAPSPLAVSSISPDPFIWSTAIQRVTVTGAGFQAGLKEIVFTHGASDRTTVDPNELENVTADSFQVPVRLGPDRIGAVTLSVTDSRGVTARNVFRVAERVLSCSAPAAITGTFDLRAPREIVTFPPEADADAVTNSLAGKYGFSPLIVYRGHALRGFVAVLSDAMMDGLRCEPGVRQIEFDSYGGAIGG